MPVPQEEFTALIRGFVLERHDDCVEGIDILAKLSQRLGDFLDEHDATLEERRSVLAIVLGPFFRADCSSQFKAEAIHVCADALGLECSWIH